MGELIANGLIEYEPSYHPNLASLAISKGLEKNAQFAAENDATVHMPRIGCGIAGGTWDKTGLLIKSALAKKNIKVTIYDF